MDELDKILTEIAAISQGNKDQLNAISGVLGILIGLLIKADLTTRAEFVQSVENISTNGSPHQARMLAIVQAAVLGKSQH